MENTGKKNEKRRVGIIGLGSIGAIHARALRSLGVKKIVALRTNKGALKSLPEDLSFVSEVYNFRDFLDYNLDGVIISNPTSLHIESLQKVLKYNIPTFVEKPISSDLSQLNQLSGMDTTFVKVGYCLRFHKIIRSVKKLLDDQVIGEIFHSKIQVSQYLPNWHSYTDYRKEYFSSKKLGGGAIRTLSHEIDLLLFFLGIPTEIFSFIGKISDLAIDVDDYSLLITKHNHIISRLEIDFLSMIPMRTGSFFGAKGELHYDIVNGIIKIIDRADKTEKFVDTFADRDMYTEQMKGFLRFIDTKESEICSYEEAVSIVEIIEIAENNNHLK